MSMRGGTGGNRFIAENAGTWELMAAINEGLVDLERWVEGTERRVDPAKVYVEMTRIPSGAISVEVTADLVQRT